MFAELHRWARLKHHALALRAARRQLRLATGDDFVELRRRVFALEFCLDPRTCDCLSVKPMRKLVEE